MQICVHKTQPSNSNVDQACLLPIHYVIYSPHCLFQCMSIQDHVCQSLCPVYGHPYTYVHMGMSPVINGEM